MATKKNEVAVAEEPKLPAVYDYGDDLGLGHDTADSTCASTPFFHVLQSNSAALETMENARAGYIINTATGELWPANAAKDGDKGLPFIPVAIQHMFTLWRANRGGFLGHFKPESVEVAESKKEALRSNRKFGEYKVGDDDLVETYYLWGIGFGADGSPQPGAMAFSGTKIKFFKNWYARAKLLRHSGRPLPLFAHMYRMVTLQQKNSEGTFFVVDIRYLNGDALESRLAPDDERYLTAREMYRAFMDGAFSDSMEKALKEGSGTDAAVAEEPDMKGSGPKPSSVQDIEDDEGFQF